MTLTARIKASLARSITILVLLGLVASLHHELFGQKTLPGRFKGFRVPAYYKAEPGQPNRLQLILQGKEAYPLANGQVQVLGLQLHYFDKDDGATNLIVEATEGFWDQITKTAYSPSDLKVVLGGGQIELQGRGFTWKQDDSILTISNDVKTTLLRPPPLNLTADRFVFNVGTNRVNYFGNVQGEDTNMILTCEALTLTLPKAATGPLDPGLAIVRVTPPSEPSQTTARPEIDRILAETNVTVVNRRDGSLVKGDRAEYLRLKEGEQIELTGHPSWKQGEREGRADLLRFYQETRLVSAIGQAYVKLPKNEMAQPGLLMPSLSVQTNQGSATGFMEVFADEFHILADGARFDGHVRIEDPTLEAGGGTVRCEKLRIFTGPDKQVSSVVMERDVVLTQGDRARITSDQLVYEKAKDTVELTGNPAWFMEGRQGNADRLSFDLGHKRLLAEGNARLKMPLYNASLPLWSFDESASELAAAGDVFLEASARYYSLDQQVVRFEDD
ncbi:MAG TPA: hypothetical protein PK256_12465, partial [Verrucomicrobiota bacterium]|nr:hypothetical protein [Verrucomicrobiota bacterium]